MSAKKKNRRIRQTRTEFQKAFDPYPGMMQPFSWSDRLPEFLHISIALIENDFQTVKSDFYKISDFVNGEMELDKRFHFNFSHTIRLVKENKSILDEIFKTCFKTAFTQLIPFYNYYFDFDISFKSKPNLRLLVIGYKQILDGRADTSILSKYLMVQYYHFGQPDLLNLFNLNSKEEILQPMNVSRIMALFPPSIGSSENLDLDFCQDIWMYNYTYSPFMEKPDDSKEEEFHYQEMNIDQLNNEFKELYTEFKKFNLLAVYPKTIAEINMGFIARICNLSLDTVELVKSHKGEIAELVFRTVLETFIVASWLLKRKDIELHQRFRDYSIGREKFFGKKIVDATENEKIKKEGKKMITNAIKNAGVRDIEVATERGNIFELRIDQMAEEVWGKDNQYYFLYKRSSGVTHGQWRVISKYHLAKSHNPMNNGLYKYNENNNKFAGLIPIFTTLPLAVNFLLRVLSDIQSKETKELIEKLVILENKIWEQYMIYFKKYILPTNEKDEEE
ncbi:MAG TPA: hypothetical protein EYG89_02915 [Bacteroidia bacterium]|nr:hypothetical protein [Bacteroidia bacterium]